MDNKIKILTLITIVLTLLLLIFGMVLVYSGIKNTDYSYNILFISYENNYSIFSDYRDVGSDGKSRSFEEWYGIGFRQMYLGFFVLILNNFILLSLLFFNSLINKDKPKEFA